MAATIPLHKSCGFQSGGNHFTHMHTFIMWLATPGGLSGYVLCNALRRKEVFVWLGSGRVLMHYSHSGLSLRDSPLSSVCLIRAVCVHETEKRVEGRVCV